MDTNGSHMTPHPASALTWERADSAEDVHALLRASDAHTAERSGLPVPERRLDSSRRLVAERAVHLLRHAAEPVAMFTLTPHPPFNRSLDVFPPAGAPLYLRRLAVHPDWSRRDPTLGLRCVRRACETARAAGADALRAEANPDLRDSVALLIGLGFVQHGPVETEGWMRRVYLQRPLDR
ncbi:GNAT family N-acetyltransferase [Streptomyces sp. NPDC006314]|uniref:GNAT family N-acetyltransferase n=1 Tax=Streptomyces sp. NPDC006314 TaxID=3154475 RepID=UPI0033A38727